MVESMPSPGEAAWLSKDEAKHALGSRRLAAGDAIELTDGRGAVASAVIQAQRDGAGRVGARVESVRHQPRMRPEVHVASALPKGDRLSSMLDMLGQLELASFTPLACERGVVKAERFDVPRAGRIFVEAMKQSRGAWITQTRPAMTPASCAQWCREGELRAWIAHPGGAAMPACDAAHACMIMIGPEGGFTEMELSMAVAAGAAPVSLGGAILRIETAAVAAASVLRLSGAS
jgi:16S rRNA (uracil1498-N3)-methyltransferase